MGRTLQEQEGQEGAVRAHDAAARGARRRQQDVEVARQLRGHRRAAGGAVRQAPVAPRRAHAPLLHAHHRLAPRPDRRGHRRPGRRLARAGRRQAPARPHRRRPVPRRRRGRRRRGRVRPGVPVPTTCPTTLADVHDPAPTSCATAASASPGCWRWRSRARCPPTRRVGARSSRAACGSTARSSPTPTSRSTPADVDGRRLQMGKRNWARLRA